MFLSRLAILAVVPACCFVLGNVSASDELKPEKTWQGAVQLKVMLVPGKGSEEEKFEPLTVIQTAAAFKTFLAELPAKQVTQTNPAPDNDDPLLKAKLDFDKHTLVVLRAGNLDGLKIKSIAEGEDAITFTVTYLPELSARPIGTGSYTAVLLPKTEKKVTVSEQK